MAKAYIWAGAEKGGDRNDATMMEETPQEFDPFSLFVEETHAKREALPPRLDVRLHIHEEVSSKAVDDPGAGSLSQLYVDGKVTAQVDCSSNGNTPFMLRLTGPMASLASFQAKRHCSPLTDEEHLEGSRMHRIEIPNSENKACEILSYTLNVRTQDMPILVQTKSVLRMNSARISAQIRSNLSNTGDLSEFTITMAIPTTYDGETVKISRGSNGTWDATKRIITWRIGGLKHGESCLVTAEAGLSASMKEAMSEDPDVKMAEKHLRCPVLVRCTSEVDQISDMAVSVLEDIPAHLVENLTRSYRLLHRVP